MRRWNARAMKSSPIIIQIEESHRWRGHRWSQPKLVKTFPNTTKLFHRNILRNNEWSIWGFSCSHFGQTLDKLWLNCTKTTEPKHKKEGRRGSKMWLEASWEICLVIWEPVSKMTTIWDRSGSESKNWKWVTLTWKTRKDAKGNLWC